MSYSFREPEWPAVCECEYDEAGDWIARTVPFIAMCPKPPQADIERRIEKRKGPAIAEVDTVSAA